MNSKLIMVKKRYFLLILSTDKEVLVGIKSISKLYFVGNVNNFKYLFRGDEDEKSN